MLETGTILAVSFLYMGLLFAIAHYGDKRADAGRSIISNPYIYALSLAVYCTAWTFYGSVGRAVSDGIGFLTIYIGPTLMMLLGWVVWLKIIRISKVHRITSIADFIASRYGKSITLGGMVSIIAVIGIIPYIALQLKAISTGFLLINQYPQFSVSVASTNIPIFQDTAFYIALLLALFAILFGTRHLDATERHEGLVAAIAFESLVKLIAFICVGVFVTYVMHDGFSDLVIKASNVPQLKNMFVLGHTTSQSTVQGFAEDPVQFGAYSDWGVYLFLSMMAILFLPRQFQVAVVENVNEEHLNKAVWLFPLYLLAINLFVIPVAISGVLRFPSGNVDADTFVLTLPMAERQQLLTLIVYLGGMSAATGMVIVETVALSTMICNNLVMPLLLRLPFPYFTRRSDFSSFLLTIRRGSIVLVLLLGYAYFHLIGEFYALVSIGMVSFAAVAQFGPAILIGIFWKGGTKSGAFWGLIIGFSIWAYTLLLPSMVQAGFVPRSFVTHGPFGIELLKPFQLFGLENFSRITHSVFWSILANTSIYIGVSIFSRPSVIGHTQAALFVDVFKYSSDTGESPFWRGTAFIRDLRSLLSRVLGKNRAEEELARYAEQHQAHWNEDSKADAALVTYAEKLMAGAIGSASARLMVASVVKEESIGVEEVIGILDETRQVIAYSRELEKTTAELKEANERLKEVDRLKDDFISTVTHELRTPLASIRSLAEILHDNPHLDETQHLNFSDIIIRESERLSRLISQVLDYEKMESNRMDWVITSVNMKDVIQNALTSTQQLIEEKKITMETEYNAQGPVINGDRDRLMQVMVNLISNAVKFCPPEQGHIVIRLLREKKRLRIDVQDNGIGISHEDQAIIFKRFRQVDNPTRGRPSGTGIGLTIAQRIIEFHEGDLGVESEPGRGATFSFTLPVVEEIAID